MGVLRRAQDERRWFWQWHPACPFVVSLPNHCHHHAAIRKQCRNMWIRSSTTKRIGIHRAILVLCLSLAACSRTPPAALPEPTPPVPPPTAATPASLATNEEPPEEVLRKFMFHRYALREAAGGLPATVPAAGYSGVIRAKLYEVHKDDCTQLPASPPGVWNCGVHLMVAMWWEGRPEPTEPLSHNEGIRVIQDDNGEWIDCAFNSGRNDICSIGRMK